MVTHRRSWLRQRTDASPHTNYLFQFLKSVAFERRCRCAVARQKRNSKLLRSFRQPLDFLLRGVGGDPNQLPRNQFFNRHPLRGGASYCLVSCRQPLRIFYFRGIDDSSNQRLRSPFFNRRPLRRRRILLSRFWPSTPSNFLFSRCRRPVGAVSSQPVFQPAPPA